MCARWKRPRQPLRVVLDSALRMPLSARMLQGGNVLIYTATHDAQKIARLEQAGAPGCRAGQTGKARWICAACMRDLAQRGCNEVLVEAGQYPERRLAAGGSGR